MDITAQTDHEVIHLVLQGNQAAYARIIEKYQNFVFTLVLRLIENREDAEEIAQDVFVKSYRSLSDFREESKFSTWLYTITRTTCISFLRKKKLNTQSLDNEKTGLQIENMESGFQANLVEQKSRHAMLNQSIAMLAPDDNQVLTLFYKGDQSLDEIGKIMGLEANTVKVKLHRARQRLKEKMEKYFAREIQEIHAG